MATSEVRPAKGFIYPYPGMHVYDTMVLPSVFPASSIEDIQEFSFQEGDVMVDSYPKAGTLWMQEILWMVHNQADVERAKQTPILDRVPSIDVQLSAEKDRNVVKLQTQPPPRLMKSHLPAKYLQHHLDEGKLKVVVLMRNPKDTLVSYYNFYRMAECFGKFTGNWMKFFDMFKNKELGYGDYFDHVTGWWSMRDRPNVLIVKYEDLHKDCTSVVEMVTKFTGQTLTPGQIRQIVEHTSFSHMRNNPQSNRNEQVRFDSSVSPYMRRGKVGDWKNIFTVNQNEYINKLCDQKLHTTALTFDFTL